MTKRYLVTVTDEMARILEQDERLNVYGSTTAEKIRALVLEALNRKGLIFSTAGIRQSSHSTHRIEYAH